MVEGRPELRAFPKSLTICTPMSHMKEIDTPLANSIRAALELTANLADLTLSVTASNFMTIFKGSKYTFTLRSLTAPLHASAGFADFLNSQKRLKEFNVLPAARGLLLQRIHPDAFPELHALSCNFQALTYLIPSRPLSRIACTKLLTTEFEAFGDLLTRSAVPIMSVDVVLVRPRSSMLGVVQAFLQSLEGVSSSIEHLSITLSFPLDFVSKHNSIYARLKQRRSTFEGFSEIRTAVAQFYRIKSFSLEHERCVNDVPPEFCRSVAELSHFGVWKQSSPALESLSIFGGWNPSGNWLLRLTPKRMHMVSVSTINVTPGHQLHDRRYKLHPEETNALSYLIQGQDLRLSASKCKATCGVIAPALYRYVTLRDRKSIESFCNAIINGRTGLRSYPQTVAFLPKKTLIKALNALVPHIKQALGLMNALVDLTLGLPGKIIKAIFRDAHPSHSLRRLSCPLVAQAGFKRFLLEQSMIKELVVIGDVRGKINVGTLIRNPDEKLLPNLESLSANYDTLNALVPGRPLKTISMGSAILNVPHFQTFGAVLSQSSTPIASLSACISCAPFLLGAVVNHLIESLNENQVFPHALSITLVFPEKTSADHRAVHPHVQECLQLMKIGQLDGLERFEVSARDCPCPLTVEFHRIAHEIALLPRWTNLCSTLKEVTLFGKLLE
ncbi:hypothetical protein RHS04_08374 [Rhizoctonia solani]|uniref:Uncharacterized protein n=1 Tax=Rhizoctonia solani TaxID=456999 RepID=A0A8H7LJG4_9AGAM|nr:hypothetical protein RHS04_08374 [Rhizoctonia solani]